MIEHEWIIASPVAYYFDLTPTNYNGKVWLSGNDIEGMGNPETADFTSETALLDGQTFAGWRAKPREVFWPVVIDGGDGSWSTLQRDFWRTMQPGVYGTWRVTRDGNVRELRCRFRSDGPAKYSFDPSLRQLEVHGVTLIADDPYWRSAEVSQTFQTAADALPFYAVTTDRVFNLMPGSTSGSGSLANPGDVPAWITYRIDGPATGFVVDGVSANISVATGEWLIVDGNPTAQTAILYHSAFVTENVTKQLLTANFGQVLPYGLTGLTNVQLYGAGSLKVSITPGYYRAF